MQSTDNSAIIEQVFDAEDAIKSLTVLENKKSLARSAQKELDILSKLSQRQRLEGPLTAEENAKLTSLRDRAESLLAIANEPLTAKENAEYISLSAQKSDLISILEKYSHLRKPIAVPHPLSISSPDLPEGGLSSNAASEVSPNGVEEELTQTTTLKKIAPAGYGHNPLKLSNPRAPGALHTLLNTPVLPESPQQTHNFTGSAYSSFSLFTQAPRQSEYSEQKEAASLRVLARKMAENPADLHAANAMHAVLKQAAPTTAEAEEILAVVPQAIQHASSIAAQTAYLQILKYMNQESQNGDEIRKMTIAKMMPVLCSNLSAAVLNSLDKALQRNTAGSFGMVDPQPVKPGLSLCSLFEDLILTTAIAAEAPEYAASADDYNSDEHFSLEI